VHLLFELNPIAQGLLAVTLRGGDRMSPLAIAKGLINPDENSGEKYSQSWVPFAPGRWRPPTPLPVGPVGEGI
jgi:hypothetical protein